jgi:lathosterol oxidase
MPSDAPSSDAPRRHPPLVRASVVNGAMVALCALFLARHPMVAPLLATPPAQLLAGARAGAVWAADCARLAASRAPADAPARAAMLRAAFDYALGSELGARGRRDFYEWSEWKNALVLPASWRAALPHVAAVWVRNYVAINVVYFGLAGGWALCLYVLFVDHFFPVDRATGRRNVPARASLAAQARVSVAAMPVYVMVPTLCEWVAERGLTRAADSLAEMGGGAEHWLLWTAAYLFFVEWAIYWIHRGLHEVRWLYKWLHEDHHVYNNQHDMSPLAGLAFHPLDGALQAAPYFVGLFLMPVHFWTHTALLFFTGVWTASIHDALPPSTEPIMGSKYHMYHHTAYRDNYGQFFVFFDWLHGTLTDPLELKGGRARFGEALGVTDPVGEALAVAKLRAGAGAAAGKESGSGSGARRASSAGVRAR